jgi:NAD(P)-dependent dehydrogenase (short-subunit alcohol dehydrogenase family)
MSQKTVIITGSNGNLGTTVTRAFLDEGYQVVGTILPGQNAPEGSAADYHAVDLTNEKETEDFFNNLKSKYDQLDGVVALAGGFGMSNISNTTQKDIKGQFDLNFITAYNTARFGYNWMKQTGGGRITLVSAKPALEGGAFEVLPYAIAKGAVAHLAEILNETANEDKIITSVIAPGIIDTPPNREAMSNMDFSDWTSPEAIAKNVLFLHSADAAVVRQPILKLYNNI